MRVLVIGAGSAGKRHIGNLLALGCDVSAYDPVDTAFHGIPHTVRRYTHAPAEDFDAFVIASPWDRHLTWAETAVALGAALFIEKPLGTLEEIPRWRSLVAECEARGIVNQVGYQLRFHEDAQWLKAIAPNFGTTFLRCDTRHWPGRNYGPFLLEASHEIDLATWMGADGELLIGSDPWVRSRESYRFQIGQWHFTMHDADAAGYERGWNVAAVDGRHRSAQFTRPEALGTAMYRAEIEHFLNAVRTGKQSPPAATLADGLKVLEIVAKVEQMAGKIGGAQE